MYDFYYYAKTVCEEGTNCQNQYKEFGESDSRLFEDSYQKMEAVYNSEDFYQKIIKTLIDNFEYETGSQLIQKLNK